MKRDWNLIRDILTAIEEDRCKKYIDNAGNNEEWQDGLDNDQIQKEYVKRKKLIEGHDLLQHMRTPKVWNKAKEIADKAGVTLTLDFLRTTLPYIPSMLTQAVKACGIN